MNLIENKTKFTHLNMPSWGVGVYRKSDGDYITVEFENAGIKKLSKATINSMLIPVGGTIETTPTPAPKKQSATKNTYAPVNDHTLNGLRHSFIVSHSEGVVWKWMKFFQRDFLNRFVHIYLRFWGKGKGVHCLNRQRTP